MIQKINRREKEGKKEREKKREGREGGRKEGRKEGKEEKRKRGKEEKRKRKVWSGFCQSDGVGTRTDGTEISSHPHWHREYHSGLLYYCYYYYYHCHNHYHRFLPREAPDPAEKNSMGFGRRRDKTRALGWNS